MTVQWSSGVRNGVLDAIETAVGTAPKFRIYSGTEPATCAAALSGNTLLAEFTLDSDWMSAAASGVKNMIKGGTTVSGANPYTTTGAATGTATFYRIYDSAGTNAHEQGTVGTSGTDAIIDNTSIASGQTVNLTQYQKTAPGA